MIYEYALDPEVLINWASNTRDFREFFREYGLGQPRVFSSFPKQKVNKLRSYLLQYTPADTQSIHSKRYTEMVTALTEAVVLREINENTSGVWQQDVLEEHARLAFHAVLTNQPLAIPDNITPETMYEVGSVWNHSRQVNVERVQEEFQRVLINLLRYSSEKIVFVDAYAWNNDSIITIAELIKGSFQKKPNCNVPEFVVLFKEKFDKSNPNAAFVKNKILEKIDLDISLSVIELIESTSSDVFHNRCVLSELGGVIYGHGLDLTDNYQETDEAILMEKQIYEKKWNQFVENVLFTIQSKA